MRQFRQFIRSAVLAGAAALVFSIRAGAAVVPNIAFTTSTDYTANFVATLAGTQVVYNSTNQNLVYTAASAGGTSIVRYDTNPGDGLQGPTDFQSETLQADFTPGTAAISNSSSMGLFTRIQSDNTGVLALINTINTASLQIRLFYGANSTSTAAGTAFFTSTFNLATGSATGGGTGSTNSIAAGIPLTLTLTETSAADPVFNLTVTDPDGLVATSGNQTLTSALSNAYDGSGSVAFRVNGVAVNDTIAIDNFSATATPEPGTLTLLAGAGITMLVRPRRNRD